MDQVAVGRESFIRQEWTDCFLALSAADRNSPLTAEDLERLGSTAHLLGREAESLDAWTRAYGASLEAGDSARAARCALWLGFQLFNAGEHARGGGWLARAQRLVAGLDCVEGGYVLAATAQQSMGLGDPAGGYGMSLEAAQVGQRFEDPTLVALATLGQAQASWMLGEPSRAIALLDEVMVAVTADEVAPVIAGLAYCAVIWACQEAFDIQRAQEWTAALSQWCELRPDVVPYRGQCLVHRAELLQFHGAWADAIEQAQRASERLSDPPGQDAVGMAHYVLAELHRLRGEWTEAEDLYRLANKCGRQPHPGLALLRLAQGRQDAAATGIRRAIDEAADQLERARLLPAAVEIVLAGGDAASGRVFADEFAGIAAVVDKPFLHAVSAQCAGAVLLAEGNGREALTHLRTALTGWQQLDAPYDAARVRVLLALACRELGDDEGSELELDAAREIFQQLGAELSGLPAVSPGHYGLSAREIEVLVLLATGATNRAIAAKLVISEKTVARHVSNIFAKLDLTSRAAATAYAYEHDLV
ncbi:regulatory LuxR family protein [Kribbella orskensis]|uniref:Regulatory LuxR family protein n=1 Tax=Kribbella orskensis TaxID=2512216 RepID=A0ABY2BIP0_9ACTN|nr:MULTISPECIES: LuxR family transcriptional regulator [Kribbella]TCN37907.1 regulatory LuxR family protein [Kribbella sp. VKM Ac-2500]TCO19393.1 regulatory LuxR family protein [Kribbella orskensis]